MNEVHEKVESSFRSLEKSERREAILTAAEDIIRDHGARELQARDVAKLVGCATGVLYNHFGNLDGLVIHVNSRTLARLADLFAEVVPKDANPKDTLVALSLAYMRFATQNPRLWAALFEYRFSGAEIPEWHQEQQAALLGNIERALRVMDPALDDKSMSVRTRTLFGAINGIVSTSLAGRFVGVSVKDLEAELKTFVCAIAVGLDPKAGAGTTGDKEAA